MNKQEFLEELTEIMQLDETITEDAVLTEFSEWDSMAYLGAISFFDIEFGKEVPIEELKKITTVAQLISAYGEGLEES
jgi:acyl carrier protein